MIDRLYILGIRRGGERIPASEIRQMIGRCGRSYDRRGTVVLLAERGDASYARDCFEGKGEDIRSTFSDSEIVSEQYLPEIIYTVRKVNDFNCWWGRTLAAMQGYEAEWDDVRDCLLDTGMAVAYEDGITASPLGVIAVRNLLPIRKASRMLEKVVGYDDDRLDAFALSWMLADEYRGEDVFDGDDDFHDYEGICKERGLGFKEDDSESGYLWWCVLERKVPFSPVGAMCRAMRDDAGRMMGILRDISEVCGKNWKGWLDACHCCLAKKLPVSHAKSV